MIAVAGDTNCLDLVAAIKEPDAARSLSENENEAKNRLLPNAVPSNTAQFDK
jgi:hypothetical protein